MRFSTVIAGLLFGLEAAALRVGPVQADQLNAEVRLSSPICVVAQEARF